MKDLIKKTEKELANLLKEKQTALRNFRFALSGSKTRNVKEGATLRKDIARIFTAIKLKKSEVK